MPCDAVMRATLAQLCQFVAGGGSSPPTEEGVSNRRHVGVAEHLQTVVSAPLIGRDSRRNAGIGADQIGDVFELAAPQMRRVERSIPIGRVLPRLYRLGDFRHHRIVRMWSVICRAAARHSKRTPAGRLSACYRPNAPTPA